MPRKVDDLCERYDTLSDQAQLLVYKHVLRRPPLGVRPVESAFNAWLALSEDEALEFSERIMSALEDVEGFS